VPIPIYADGAPIAANAYLAGDTIVLRYSAAQNVWNSPPQGGLREVTADGRYMFSGADGSGNGVTSINGSFTLAQTQSGLDVFATTTGATVTLPAPALGNKYRITGAGLTFTTPSGTLTGRGSSGRRPR